MAAHVTLSNSPEGVEVPAGLLYYTQSEEVIRVPVLRNELRGLLILRNEIAAHTIYREEVEADPPQQHTSDSRRATAMKASKRMQLPPSIDDQWACSKCYKIDACMLYRNVQNSPHISGRQLLTAGLTRCSMRMNLRPVLSPSSTKAERHISQHAMLNFSVTGIH